MARHRPTLLDYRHTGVVLWLEVHHGPRFIRADAYTLTDGFRTMVVNPTHNGPPRPPAT